VVSVTPVELRASNVIPSVSSSCRIEVVTAHGRDLLLHSALRYSDGLVRLALLSSFIWTDWFSARDPDLRRDSNLLRRLRRLSYRCGRNVSLKRTRLQNCCSHSGLVQHAIGFRQRSALVGQI
jgi:hypothetical protein